MTGVTDVQRASGPEQQKDPRYDPSIQLNNIGVSKRMKNEGAALPLIFRLRDIFQPSAIVLVNTKRAQNLLHPAKLDESLRTPVMQAESA